MKKELYFIMIAVLGVVSLGNAQAQNPECMTNLSIYSEHVKVKNYDAAYEPWKMVYDNCPDINRANFLYGERILKDKIKKSSGADQEAYVHDLLTLYAKSREYFPSKFPMGTVDTKKAMLMREHSMESPAKVLVMLEETFQQDRANFKDPKAIYTLFSNLVDEFEKGNRELQEVFDLYDDLGEKIEEENKKLTGIVTKLLPKEEAGTLTTKEKRQLRAATVNSQSYGKIAGSIDSKLGKLADCENLIPLYEKNFEEKKGDIVWVKRAVGRMFAKECTDDPLFAKLFQVQVALDPSADAYVYEGTLKQKSGDTKGAVQSFNKAVELETDSYKKSNILYKVATIYRRGSKSTARGYAQRAIEANPANGKAYLLIASLYASSANQCGTDVFSKRAVYWKAAETARKAGRVDPSLSGRAKQSAASYNAKAPSKTDIFNSGKAGQTISFSCWVGGSVKVPNL